MPKKTECNCEEQPELVEISNEHSAFKSKLNELAVGDWVLLMTCPNCDQLWIVDEWDKYQASYAIKISTQENWELFDAESLVKEKMIQNHGGLTQDDCMWSGCNSKQVKGSALCVNHLYEGGARA